MSSRVKAQAGHGDYPGNHSSGSQMVPYETPEGWAMSLSPRAFAGIADDLGAIPDAKAHPSATPLLFRYQTATSRAVFHDGGLAAGRFAWASSRAFSFAEPPDRHTQQFWRDVAIHLDHEQIDTPFISTTNSLVWVLRQALKRPEASDTKIIVIDREALDSSTVFFAQPFQAELKKKYVYRNGAWNYPASHEHLVYGRIPPAAVLHSFDVRALLDLASSRIGVAQMLRLDELKIIGGGRDQLKARMKEGNVDMIAERTIHAMCLILDLSGFTPSSPMFLLASMIENLVGGWQLQARSMSRVEWDRLADRFTGFFCRHCGVDASFQVKEEVSLAFLVGVQWAQGTFNWRHSPADERKLQRNATSIGLQFVPGVLMAGQADAEKRLQSFKRLQLPNACLSGRAPMLVMDMDESNDPPSPPGLLLDVEEANESPSPSPPGTPTPGPSNWHSMTTRKKRVIEDYDGEDGITREW